MKTIVALAALLIPIISFAHPGHGSTDGFNLTHYFIEPEHAVFTWTFVLIGQHPDRHVQLMKFGRTFPTAHDS